MQKIQPCLWLDGNAEEAAEFYTSLFNDSKIGSVTRYNDIVAQAAGRPAGSVMTVTFQLAGREFMALNGGPMFKFTPAISFMVSCGSESEVETLWSRLSENGSVLMDLGKYPFSDKYGWVQDKYGLSWQLILQGDKQDIAPCLLFVNEKRGRAEEAVSFYRSKFGDSETVVMERYGADEAGSEGTVKFSRFRLDGCDMIAMDGPGEHAFDFSPAVSFMVNCKDQDEVDHFWEQIADGGGHEQCGWLHDKFGVSWQIVPIALGELLKKADPERSERLMKELLQMTKLDADRLRKAYEQTPATG